MSLGDIMIDSDLSLRYSLLVAHVSETHCLILTSAKFEMLYPHFDIGYNFKLLMVC